MLGLLVVILFYFTVCSQRAQVPYTQQWRAMPTQKPPEKNGKTLRKKAPNQSPSHGSNNRLLHPKFSLAGWDPGHPLQSTSTAPSGASAAATRRWCRRGRAPHGAGRSGEGGWGEQSLLRKRKDCQLDPQPQSFGRQVENVVCAKTSVCVCVWLVLKYMFFLRIQSISKQRNKTTTKHKHHNQKQEATLNVPRKQFSTFFTNEEKSTWRPP